MSKKWLYTGLAITVIAGFGGYSLGCHIWDNFETQQSKNVNKQQ